ncbi:hypothetical protein AAG570_013284 [Ranatra chinensis]|uniref:Uncharacterized protein n=1 Tax=Ranatra chinensis TaxID=642074 RepID=A0ABD0YGA4_9HEMI
MSLSISETLNLLNDKHSLSGYIPAIHQIIFILRTCLGTKNFLSSVLPITIHMCHLSQLKTNPCGQQPNNFLTTTQFHPLCVTKTILGQDQMKKKRRFPTPIFLQYSNLSQTLILFIHPKCMNSSISLCHFCCLSDRSHRQRYLL